MAVILTGKPVADALSADTARRAGALRQRGISSRRIVGALAAAAGIAQKGEEVSPEELLGRFSWEKIAAHREDIVINDEFLLGLVG